MLILSMILALQTPPAPASAELSPAEACAFTRHTLERRINRVGRISMRLQATLRDLDAITAYEHTHAPWPEGLGMPTQHGLHPAYVELTADEMAARLDVCLETYPITPPPAG